jgi:hypothetical protein
MSRQYHYVVVWNVEKGRFEIDIETMDSNFPNGEIWNEDAQEWESRYEIDGMNEAYLDIEDVLARALSDVNDMLEDLSTEADDMNKMVNEMDEEDKE